MQIGKWWTDKAALMKDYAYETVVQVKAAFTTAWSARSYISYIFDFSQFWEGWTRAAQPNIVPALFKSPKTRHVIARSLTANLLFYAGAVFIYEAAIKPAFEETPFERTTKILTAWYFWRLSLRLFIAENPLYNASLSKAVSKENSNVELFPACVCGENSLNVVKGNLASGFYYVSNIIAANLMGTIIPYSKSFFLAHAYGSVLMEYNLGSMCTTHRYEVLSKNNSYKFGLGLSMITINKIAAWAASITLQKTQQLLFSQSTEIDDAHIKNAIEALVFQYFIILALLIDKPYPGKEKGIDFFYYPRHLMGSILKDTGEKIIVLLKQPSTQDLLTPILNAINSFPPLQLLKNLFLYPNYQSKDRLVKTPEVQLFLDLRGDDIQNTLNWFINKRKKTSTKAMSYLPNILIEKKIKAIIKFLVKKNLDGVLENTNNFITTARIKIIINDLKALQDILNSTENDEETASSLLPGPSAILLLENQGKEAEKLSIGPLLIEDYAPQTDQSKTKQLNARTILDSCHPLTTQNSIFKKSSSKKFIPEIELEDGINKGWEDLGANSTHLRAAKR